MIAKLREARRLLERCGWTGPALEPFCRARGPGVRLNRLFGPEHPAESMWLHVDTFNTLDFELDGVEQLSVYGALQLAGAWPEGWYVLERVVGDDLDAWLRERKRTAGDVLRVFTTAVLRSREKRT